MSFSLVASGLYWWGIKRKSKFPEKVYSNEALLFLGVVATAGAVYELGRVFDTGSGRFSILLFLSFIIYGVLGSLFNSNLIWIFSLASSGSWYRKLRNFASKHKGSDLDIHIRHPEFTNQNVRDLYDSFAKPASLNYSTQRAEIIDRMISHTKQSYHNHKVDRNEGSSEFREKYLFFIV